MSRSLRRERKNTTFEGVVIRKKKGGIRSSFTVRKISYGIGVERFFHPFSRSIGSM